LTIESVVAVLEAPRRVLMRREMLQTSLGPHDVLCATEVSVISPGTELAAFVGAPALRPGVGYPRLLGYCNVARILECGTAVKTVAPGARILTFASHRSHFVTSAEEILAVLSADVPGKHAACSYLFHLGYSAVLDSGLRAGSTVVVIGLGVLGLASIATAALAGADVIAVGDQAHSQRIARELGARAVYGRADATALLEEVGEARADAVITTSNAWSDWPLALQCAGMRATVAVLGFPGRNEPPPSFNPLDSQHFYTRQLRIVASGMQPQRADDRGYLRFNERTNLARLLRWIEQGRLSAGQLISGEVEGRELASAYERLLARAEPAVTFALRWSAGR
jgi:threonine dehydrogenase-like Zn-dependent dehydrogenase